MDRAAVGTAREDKELVARYSSLVGAVAEHTGFQEVVVHMKD